MKNSNSILKILAFALLIVWGSSTAYSAATQNAETTYGCMAIGCVALPFTGGLLAPATKKKSEWKKDAPVMFLTVLRSKMLGALNTPSPQIQGIQQGEVVSGGALTASGSSMNVSAPVEASFADFSVGRALEFKLTFGTTYAGGVTPILPQYTNDALPTGVTFTSAAGAFTTYQKFVNFYCKFPTKFTKVTVTVDDATNFTNSFSLTKTYADGNTTSISRSWDSMALDPYAVNTTTRIIEHNFWSGSDLRFEIVAANIPGSGTKYFNFAFDIGTIGNSTLQRRPEA